MKTIIKRSLLLCGFICAVFGIAACDEYYAGYPGYNAPYYGGYGGPYYAGYPGSVTIAVGDRPYYVHGPGYYTGHTYYAWRAGHWGWRHGHRAWIHGHYVVRGY